MKKAILIVICILIFTNVSATHIIGYDMTLTRIGSTDTYKVTLTIYRDSRPGNSYMPYSQNFKTYNQGTNDDANVNFTVNRVQLYSAVYDLQNCPPKESFSTLDVGVFEATITQGQVALLNNSSGYYFAASYCCRVQNATNIIPPSNGFGITFTMDFPKLSSGVTKYNSSPRFKNIPLTYFKVNKPCIVNWACTDPDGDSLVYSLMQPNSDGNVTKPFLKCAYNLGYGLGINILDGSPDLTINAVTGEMKFTPTIAGQYYIGVKVDELRKINGVWTKIGEVIRECLFQTLIVIEIPSVLSDKMKRTNSIKDTINITDTLTYRNEFNAKEQAGDKVYLKIEAEQGKYNNILDSTLFNIKFGKQYGPLYNASNINGLILSSTDSMKTRFTWVLDSTDIKKTPYKFKMISFDETCPTPLADTIEVELSVLGSCANRNQYVITGCDSVIDHFGIKHYLSATTKDTIIGVIGCDTIITQYITVNHSYKINVESEGCDSVLGIDGKFYGKSAILEKVYHTATNCDSTITQNIIVHTRPKANPILGDITIADPTFTNFYGTLDQANTKYSWSTVNGTILTGQGTNVVEVKWHSMGAGSITCVLTDSSGFCSVSSMLATTILTGINEELSAKIKVYPSPTNDVITLEGLTANENTRVQIYNLNGQKVLSEMIKEKGQIDLTKLMQGVYIIKVGEVVKRVVRM